MWIISAGVQEKSRACILQVLSALSKSLEKHVVALGDVDMTKSWREEKNASAFFESQETALPEGRTRRVLRLSAVQDFLTKIFSTAFGSPRCSGSSKIF